MTIKDCNDGKLITLSKPFDTRPKILNTFYFIVFFGMATAFLRLLLFDSAGIGSVIFTSLVSVVFYICAFRFANKAASAEKIFINKRQLDIIQQGLYNSRKQSFDVSKISNFRHLAKASPPRHPLSGYSFDYLGFQTQQQLINDMHGENRIAFDYNGKQITFGNNIYSWDFGELEVLLYDVTGNDLRFNDESEKTFRPDEESQQAT